jgi:hypothetical protein
VALITSACGGSHVASPAVDAQRPTAAVIAQPEELPIEIVEDAPPVTAAELKAVKGPALYFFEGPHAEPEGQIAEWGSDVDVGQKGLVKLKTPGRALALLALATKRSPAGWPELRPGKSIEGGAWVTQEPFAFGGAVWDGGSAVLFADMDLGPVIAERGGGAVLKVRVNAVTLKVARLADGGRFMKPVALVRGSFAGRGTEPVFHEGAAVWPRSVQVLSDGAVEITYAVDSLVDPLYTGPDRSPEDGFFRAVFHASQGYQLRSPPERVGALSFKFPEQQPL